MKNNKEKSEARSLLKDNWKKAVLCTVVYIAIVFFVDSIEFLQLNEWLTLLISTLLYLFLYCPLSAGYLNSFHNFIKYGCNDFMGTTFKLFSKNYVRYLKGMGLMNLRVFLYSLLFVFPGVLMAFNYSMTPFILADRPELTINKVLELSSEMMYGNRMKLFKLGLSYIGWLLLSVLTFGIIYLWVKPYLSAALAIFYEEIKSEYESSK